MRQVSFQCVLWVSVACLFSAPVYAYTFAVTKKGLRVFWKAPVHLELIGNIKNSSGLSGEDIFATVTHGLQRWKQASGQASSTTLGFEYWQGADDAIYPPNSDYNGVSSIYFSSAAKGDPHLSSDTIGMTQLWYSTDTGEMIESDIVLNDRDFTFTTNPKDTSGYGSGLQSYSFGNSGNSGTSGISIKTPVFIDNVVTHELGHAFGLAHSVSLQSTMLYLETPEQAHLACDDEVAINALYPGVDADLRGSIRGSVVRDSGETVFGAQVVAISRRRGAVLATALTDSSGNFKIAALESGDYELIVEPFLAGVDVLPGYYAGATDCPGGKHFARTFLSDKQLSLTVKSLVPVSVASAQETVLPSLVVSCIKRPLELTTNESESPTVVFDGQAGQAGFGVVDEGDLGEKTERYYKLNSVQGTLEVHALGFSLFSPVRSVVSLVDSKGVLVSAQYDDKVYTGDSGFVNYDSMLLATGLPEDIYYLKINNSILDYSVYPTGNELLGHKPFVVLVGSVNEGNLPLAEQLPANARCRFKENYSAYVSRSQNPPPPRAVSQSGDGGGGGACGTVEVKRGEGGRLYYGKLIGWVAPWLLMFGFVQRLRHRDACAKSIMRLSLGKWV